MIRCMPCAGSGKIMGGGMLIQDCVSCDGLGKLEKDLKTREAESYSKAIKEIKALYKNMTDDEAKKIFDEEFEKLEKKGKRKKGK